MDRNELGKRYWLVVFGSDKKMLNRSVVAYWKEKSNNLNFLAIRDVHDEFVICMNDRKWGQPSGHTAPQDQMLHITMRCVLSVCRYMHSGLDTV